LLQRVCGSVHVLRLKQCLSLKKKRRMPPKTRSRGGPYTVEEQVWVVTWFAKNPLCRGKKSSAADCSDKHKRKCLSDESRLWTEDVKAILRQSGEAVPVTQTTQLTAEAECVEESAEAVEERRQQILAKAAADTSMDGKRRRVLLYDSIPTFSGSVRAVEVPPPPLSSPPFVSLWT
jgi:hypothetical protein